MINCKEFQYHFGDIVGERKKVDNTIYSFDIETSSYLILNGKVLPAIKYLDLTEEEQRAIARHNALYGAFKYDIQDKETPLYMIIHFADMWASRVIEK